MGHWIIVFDENIFFVFLLRRNIIYNSYIVFWNINLWIGQNIVKVINYQSLSMKLLLSARRIGLFLCISVIYYVMRHLHQSKLWFVWVHFEILFYKFVILPRVIELPTSCHFKVTVKKSYLSIKLLLIVKRSLLVRLKLIGARHKFYQSYIWALADSDSDNST